jgi:hypothetical protein
LLNAKEWTSVFYQHPNFSLSKNSSPPIAIGVEHHRRYLLFISYTFSPALRDETLDEKVYKKSRAKKCCPLHRPNSRPLFAQACALELLNFPTVLIY